MNRIDEWTPIYPKQGESSGKRDPSQGGSSSKRASRAGGAAVPEAPNLVEAIRSKLMSLDPPPFAVHFYLGEGLRWIRVGFNDGGPRAPSDVRDVGQAIRAGIADARQPLYFHALRPHDLLFFMEHDDPDSTGMPPACFGTPLEIVLQAWDLEASDAPRQARRRRDA